MRAGIRRTASGDEGVALLFVVVAMLILASLSLLSLGAIIGQVAPAQYARKSGQTINAAQAGLNAGLAAIREATYVENGAQYGDRTKVPCWTSHPGSLQAPQGGTTLTYAVTIRYYKSDPGPQSATWRTTNALSCVTGIGTLVTPAFALISSAAGGPGLPDLPAASGNRTLEGTYTLSLTNPNLPGGLIKDANGLCYAGGLVAGAGVTVTTCAPGADEQMWTYTAKYQLALVATGSGDGTNGLCLAANTAPVAVFMKACSSTDYAQLWGVNGSNPVHLFGHLTGVYAKTWCLGSATPGTAGAAASVSTGTCSTTNQGVIPATWVGAGAAGTTLKSPADVSGKPFQWVNYQEFGRCFDITSWAVTAAIDIVYPCKQDPMASSTTAASPGWNEVFTWNMDTLYFYANAASTSGTPSDPSNPAYCMKSPNKVGGYVTFATKCTSVTTATAAAYQWTVNRDTGVYATSYTIVDSYGRCLSNGPASGSYSSVITNTCDGSDGQKWNAPPGFTVANLASVNELFASPS